LFESEILSNVRVADDLYLLTFRAPEIALRAQPGQFVHVRCNKGEHPFLRRPFSIYLVERETGMVKVLYKTVGIGTALLAEKRKGEQLDVLGPLGKGFNSKAVQKSALLIGEGAGLASLMFLAEDLRKRGVEVSAILGGQRETVHIGKRYFKALGVKVETVEGDTKKEEYQREMAELFREALGKGVDRAFGCGSNHLLALTAHVARMLKIPYEVSIYQNMACGVGACLCCVRKIREEGKLTYKLVCKDGPVFNAEEVVWEV